MRCFAHLSRKLMLGILGVALGWLSVEFICLGFLTSPQVHASENASGFQWTYLWVQVDQKLHRCDLKIKSPCAGTCPLECEISDLGRGLWDESAGKILWYPSRSGQKIGGLGVEAKLPWTPTKQYRPRVLSNGFQSWSYSGLMEIPPPQKLSDLMGELSSKSMRGEEFRDGQGPSWEYSALLDRQQHIFAGAVSAERWSSWVRFGWSPPDLGIFTDFAFMTSIVPYDSFSIDMLLVSGMNGDEVEVPVADPVASERWILRRGFTEQFSSTLSFYQRSLDRQIESEINREFQTADSDDHQRLDLPEKLQNHLGWNSWYHLWNKVTQKDLVYNLEVLRPFFKLLNEWMPKTDIPGQTEQKDRSIVQAQEFYGFATIDDGWQIRWGDWRPNQKFAPSLAEMVQVIESQGYRAGLWLAPFLVDIKSPLIADHPDWFVETDDFIHPSGIYKILDVTHPEVKEHLIELFTEIREASFKFVKLDFLYTATFPGKRYQPMTSIEAYREGLSIMREALGEGVEILACGAPHLPSRPYVDRWRLGPDIAYEYPLNAPVWVDIAIQARNIGARSFLCQRSTDGASLARPFACDSDPWLVRGRRKGREIQSALWVSSLTGSGVILSDDFSRVPIEKLNINLSQKAIHQALSGAPAHADFNHWVTQKSSPRLYGTSPWERLWDTGGSSINAPVRWNLEQGTRLSINFTPLVLTLSDGTKVHPRESFLESKKSQRVFTESDGW